MAKEEPYESEDVACDQCVQVFPNLPKLMAHIRKAEGHEPICKTCDIPFKNFHNLRHHKRVYHIQKMTEHVCEDCGKSFPNALAARSHWNFVHKIEDDLLCNICGMSCQNMKKLKKHTQMCLAKEPEVIDKLIRERPHIEIDSIFLKQSFEKYLKENHGADINGKPEDDDSENENDVKKNDRLDDSIVKREPSEMFEYGVSHLAQSELKDDDHSDNPGGGIKIKIKLENKVGKIEKDDKDLKLEGKPRVPSMTCPFCSKEVKFFKRHMKTKHSEIPEELYLFYEKAKTKKPQTPRTSQVCPICAVEVKYLDRHIQTQHNGNDTKEFKCNECGKAFKNQYNLKDHKYAAHRKEPSMCEICSRVFKNPHALKGHVRLYHEAKEEQTCSECNNTFESKMKLYFHMRAVHTIENAKCEYCGKSYKNKSLLKKHQRVSHPEGKDVSSVPSQSQPVGTETIPENLSSGKPRNTWKESRSTPDVKREVAPPTHSPMPQNLTSEAWTEKPSTSNTQGQYWGASRDSEDVKREVSNHIQSLAQALCDGQRPENLSSNPTPQSQYWTASRSSPEPRRDLANPIHALAQALTEGQRAENLSSNTQVQYWGSSRETHEVKREAVPHLPHLPQHLTEGSWSDRFTPSNHSHSWTPNRPSADMNFSPYYSSPSPNLPAPGSNWGRLASYPGQIPPNIWKNWWTPPPPQP